jgi:ankyrin repeat protein
MSTKRSQILAAVRMLLAIGLILGLLSCAKDKNEKLIRASKKGRLEEVTRFLNSGADVNAKDNDGATALKRAHNYGNKVTVELLKAH